MQTNPIHHDLVLVGGGHANIQVIRSLYLKPIKHVRVTLISDVGYAPYSGMLPGLLAGWYRFDDAHFDLQQIANKAGCRYLQGEVYQVDLENRSVTIPNRPPVPFNTLSINTGSRPSPFAEQETNRILPVKPISAFLKKWEAMVGSLQNGHRIAIVGGGVAGVEIALILAQLIKSSNLDCKIHLLQMDNTIVPNLNPKTRRIIEQALSHADVELLNQIVVEDIKNTTITGHRHNQLWSCDFDYILLATPATAPSWFAGTGLPVDKKGFLQTEENLQLKNMPGIFAAGDCSHFNNQALPKSGVYAVRQGQVLAENIRRHILKQTPLRKYKPQVKTLALITCGEKAKTVLDYGQLSLQSRFTWQLKDIIDRKFMRKFKLQDSNVRGQTDVLPKVFQDKKACGGCGAKVDSQLLKGTRDALNLPPNQDVLVGVTNADDAAVTRVPKDHLLVQSVDQFRAFTADEYLFGYVATLNGLSDIYAMGTKAHYCQVCVTVPEHANGITTATLCQMMSGVKDALAADEVALVGGHTVYGQELAIGIMTSGFVKQPELLLKGTLNPKDDLIITKPLGTGAILAGAMAGVTSGHVLNPTLAQMCQSNRRFLTIHHKYNCSAATDITGFGLVNHLLEMLDHKNLGAQLHLAQIPLLKGFSQLVASGHTAKLSHANRLAAKGKISEIKGHADHHLYDPQTNGGILLGVAPSISSEVIAALRAQGYGSATKIGCVAEKPGIQLMATPPGPSI